MITEYVLTLKSGVIMHVTHGEKGPIGLWVWSINQASPKVLTFDNGLAVLSTEIACIQPLEVS